MAVLSQGWRALAVGRSRGVKGPTASFHSQAAYERRRNRPVRRAVISRKQERLPDRERSGSLVYRGPVRLRATISTRQARPFPVVCPQNDAA